MPRGLLQYLRKDECELALVVRQFARDRLQPLDRACDRDESSICAALPEVAAMGLLNMRLHEDLGGLGASRAAYAAMLHELAAASPSMAVTVSVHSMVGELLSEFGSARVQREILPHWGQADSLSSFAISEPDAGSDPSGALTRAAEEDGRWVFNGSKMWITNGLVGRWFATLAQTRHLGDRSGLCMILLDGQQDGVERVQIHGKMGIRGSETVSLHLTQAVAPLDHLLGSKGSGLALALRALDGGRIAIASQSTGIAEASLHEMVAYARQRRQFGQPIGNFQAIQAMIADSAVELEAAKALIIRACVALDRGERATLATAQAKLFASEAAGRIADRAVQVHGGSGFVNDTWVEQLYRDARVTRIYEGTSEIQRLVIARELCSGGAKP